jgi:hypothetical protein
VACTDVDPAADELVAAAELDEPDAAAELLVAAAEVDELADELLAAAELDEPAAAADVLEPAAAAVVDELAVDFLLLPQPLAMMASADSVIAVVRIFLIGVFPPWIVGWLVGIHVPSGDAPGEACGA